MSEPADIARNALLFIAACAAVYRLAMAGMDAAGYPARAGEVPLEQTLEVRR